MVLATQNPIEHEGTYRLPEAQVDRFMMKVVIGYPSQQEEREIMDRQTSGVIPDVWRSMISRDRKSTRLNSSQRTMSYAAFCLKQNTTVEPNFRPFFSVRAES